MKYIFSVFFFTLQGLHSGFSQTGELGTWNIINLRYSLTDKLTLFGEGQLRSLKFYDHYHYYEYKGGVQFKAHKNLQLALGAGSYQTYKEGGDFVKPKNNDEFRLWPQAILSHAIGGLLVEQRYRTELRFTTNGYRNRFRYRVGLAYPFGKEKNGQAPYQVGVSNELFFTNQEPYFERNRFQFALSYRPSPTATVQVGYVYQFDYRINDETGRDFFQVAYLLELFPASRAKSFPKSYKRAPVDLD